MKIKNIFIQFFTLGQPSKETELCPTPETYGIVILIQIVTLLNGTLEIYFKTIKPGAADAISKYLIIYKA